MVLWSDYDYADCDYIDLETPQEWIERQQKEGAWRECPILNASFSVAHCRRIQFKLKHNQLLPTQRGYADEYKRRLACAACSNRESDMSLLNENDLEFMRGILREKEYLVFQPSGRVIKWRSKENINTAIPKKLQRLGLLVRMTSYQKKRRSPVFKVSKEAKKIVESKS